MKIKFLGTGGFFTLNNFHSNIVLESCGKKLLIDCGTDIRFSLKAAGEDLDSIDSVYISHMHGDHIGGLEWLAYAKYFREVKSKPTLYAHPTVMPLIWPHISSSMTLQQSKTTLDTFFHVTPTNAFSIGDVDVQTVQTIHYHDGHDLMPSYGLFMTDRRTHSTVFLTTDTQFCLSHFRPYFDKANFIFHDCETYDWKGEKKSGVHAHYSELKTLPLAYRSKVWLYHYQDGELPPKDGFGGFVQKGQGFEI